jgi:membrane-bound lytic murein transglycosylase D
MPALLDKSYAHSLLFLLGLVLGGAQEPAKKTAPIEQDRATPTQSQPQTPPDRTPIVVAPARAPVRTGAESDELALLRKAESEMFGDSAPSAKEPWASPGQRQFTCAPDPLGRYETHPLRNDPDTSGFWASLKPPSIPVRQDARVEKYIRYFSQNRDGRGMFTTWLRRSGRYRDVIAKALRERNLPQELIAVAFIESGLNPTAVSPAGATGMWQFMTQTGRAYGLSVDGAVDERRSIWRSTDAAVRHLADLHDYFRSWDLALAAYNYGYKGLSERIEQVGTEDFWWLTETPGVLPRETTLYVPKVLAVAVLLSNLETFGFQDLPTDTPLEASEIEVPGGVRLSMLARASGTTLTRIRALNPEFRKESTPERASLVKVHIPSNGLARARVMLPRLIEQASDDITDMKVSPEFDWGRDDLTDWSSRLEQAEQASPSDPAKGAIASAQPGMTLAEPGLVCDASHAAPAPAPQTAASLRAELEIPTFEPPPPALRVREAPEKQVIQPRVVPDKPPVARRTPKRGAGPRVDRKPLRTAALQRANASESAAYQRLKRTVRE